MKVFFSRYLHHNGEEEDVRAVSARVRPGAKPLRLPPRFLSLSLSLSLFLSSSPQRLTYTPIGRMKRRARIFVTRETNEYVARQIILSRNFIAALWV